MTDFTDTRVSEKKFYSIPDTLLTADGTADGLITVPSTYPYKVGMVVSLSSTTLQPRRLKIKRVISETEMYIGEEKTKINEYSDLSIFLLADAATITYLEQQRPVIDILEIQRQVYEEEPTVALRQHSVDWLGRPYDKTNPLPVQLSDGSINIGTVNAELEVQLSHLDNVPDAGDVADSVQVGDGNDILQINADGSINVNVVQSTDNTENILNVYDEQTNVISGSETVIVAFTAATGRISQLQRIQFTGEQIGLYKVYVNGVVIASTRTHHGSGLSSGFEFVGAGQEGLPINGADVIELKVLHNRPSTGDFEGRMQIYEAVPTTIPFTLVTESDDFLITEFDDNLITE
jgi:hypothetical protein